MKYYEANYPNYELPVTEYGNNMFNNEYFEMFSEELSEEIMNYSRTAA